jgi:hypothetical protein
VLPFNPIVTDSVGWPCLRFESSKTGSDHLIPFSDKDAATVRSQQTYVLERWPQGSPWLFPGIMDNPNGTRPYAHASLSHQPGPGRRRSVFMTSPAGQCRKNVLTDQAHAHAQAHAATAHQSPASATCPPSKHPGSEPLPSDHKR